MIPSTSIMGISRRRNGLFWSLIAICTLIVIIGGAIGITRWRQHLHSLKTLNAFKVYDRAPQTPEEAAMKIEDPELTGHFKRLMLLAKSLDGDEEAREKPEMKHVRKDSLVLLYEHGAFMTIVESLMENGPEINNVRTLIGSLHRLRAVSHLVPQFHLFCLQQVPAKLVEEIRTWSGVQLYSIPVYLDLPLMPDQKMVDLGGFERVRALLMHRLLQAGETHGHLIWVKLGWSFEPVGNSLAEAEKTQDPHRIEAVLAKGRDIVMSAMQMVIRHGSLRSVSGNVTVLEGWSQDHPSRAHLTNQVACYLGTPDCQKEMDRYPLTAPIKPNSDFGMWPNGPKTTALCYVDVREESVVNQALVGHLDETTPKPHVLERFKSRDLKKLAMALPTTSKGMKEGEDPVFLTALLPSIIQTMSEAEWYRFNIIIYVGFDHGDAVYDNYEERKGVKEKASKIIGERPIIIKFLRLPNTHRVAMLWSMMFVRAMSEGADYFYQVNDDVTMVTAGWLTRFTTALDANGGFGVVGPFDTHNQLNCTVLTQAMVTRQHYDIFTLFYPTDLRDWKTDRWLTNVYGPDNTFCWEAIKVKNGASPTRYHHCEFLSWRIYLEAGRRRISKWLESHTVNRNAAQLAALPPKTPPAVTA